MQLPDFKDKKLLITALTHRSALNEDNASAEVSNERLEFLGDAVLELATTRFLYNKFPNTQEGLLTAYRSALVKTETLAEVAQTLNLGEKLYLSKGEEASGGRTNVSLLADTMEAVIGALYLDSGFEIVAHFLEEILFTKVDKMLKQKLYQDAKSHLQEVVQAHGQGAPIYEVISEKGPDHNKEFTINVLVDGKIYGVGKGSSKQRAQRDAAEKALLKM